MTADRVGPPAGPGGPTATTTGSATGDPATGDPATGVPATGVRTSRPAGGTARAPATGPATGGATAVSPGTSTGPTPRAVARRLRGPLVLAGLLVLALAAVALLSRPGTVGALEPESPTPAGARALAVLLEQRGVAVRRAGLVEEALGGPRTTVLVPFPDRLTRLELSRLTAVRGELVLVGAAQEHLDALGARVDARARVAVERRRPACGLPAASVAGVAEVGGTTYRSTGPAGTGCYATGDRAPLLRVPAQRLILLGDGSPLSNEALDDEGNAALALGLLGTGDEVRWLLPRPDRPRDDSAEAPLAALLPRWVVAGALQLVVAAAVVMLWRARRLGRVVTEPLPVVVRSAEAVEGRGRLYRAAGARDSAAGALREAARQRLLRRLGLPVSVGPDALGEAVAASTGRPPTTVLAALHGPPPVDDAALVRLADDLDALVHEVEQGETGGPRPVEAGSRP